MAMVDRAQVIQGDCIKVMHLMADASVDMIFTDPPYGHRNNNGGDLISKWEQALGRGRSPVEGYRPISNDGPEADDLFRAAIKALGRPVQQELPLE